MLLTSAFSKQNSAISLEEWVLVLKVFTTATRKLGVNVCTSGDLPVVQPPQALPTAVIAWDRLVGQVVRRLPQERKIPGSNPACAGIFSGSSHTSDSKIGTPVATLPGAWRYRVSAGTGRPGVSILWLCEVESLICNFYLRVAAHEIVWADLSLRYTRMLLGR